MPTERELMEMFCPRVLTREEFYAPFPLSKEAYNMLPPDRQQNLLYCPASETAKWLDPEDPRDVELMNNWRRR